MKVFILEDEAYQDHGFNNPPRNKILQVLAKHDLTVALDPEDAKLKFDPGAKYSLILLDHDMEGWPNPDMSYKNCGLRFVEWMLRHRLPTPQPTIYLHSQNSKGVKTASKLLVTAGYKRIIEMPYGKSYITHLQAEFGA